ncbi:MAG: ATP-dependent Clp protease proteolytic subunit [Clostridia bacterium]|nr:ATP-dependent Clp protease proteolytic subunit [Clostridia bacterium]
MCEKAEQMGAGGEGSIFQTGSIVSAKDGTVIQCLTVIGQVEGHYLLGNGQKVTKYEHLIPMLVSIEESNEVDGLLLILNTMGGDVEAGLALAEMIASMKKPTVSLVLGGGHSIGVPLAVCTNRSFIVPTATMTVHPVRISGTVVGAPQTFYYFQRMQDRILRFITEHSNIKEEKLRALLLQTDEIATDVGSILDGEEAVAAGLIDRMGGLSDALEALHEMVRERKREE